MNEVQLNREHTERLILVRGLPGSGKSTTAQSISDEYGYIHLEADMYFEKDGEYAFDRNKLEEAHEWCLKQTKSYLRSGFDVIVSNTFTQSWELKPYIEILSDDDIKIIECTGRFKNIHDVPVHVLENMNERFHNINKVHREIGGNCIKYGVINYEEF